jgi:tetratricopeptide (TPR) repeat protein
MAEIGVTGLGKNQQQQTFDRATEFLKIGDAATAERLCRAALLEFPEDANILSLSGRALIKLGRYEDAEEQLNTAISVYPEFPRPYVIRGDLRMSQGLFQQAALEFQRAIDLGDSDSNTQLKLGKALMMKGDRESAKLAVNESMRLDPSRKLLVEAHQLEKAGKRSEAEKTYRDILARDPENVEAMRLLAGIATAQHQHRDAETLLERVLELAPDFDKGLADLVASQIEQEKTEEAIVTAKRLTRISAGNPGSHMFMGNAYSASGQYPDAIEAYRKALSLSPEHAGALSGLAHNLKTIGRQDEAIETYRTCIKANPFFTEAYWSLANLKTFRFSDEEFRSMEKLVEQSEIPSAAQVHLFNALGLEYESRGNFDQAFECFDRCNSVRRGQEYYDPAHTEVKHDEIVEVFDRDFVRQPTSDAKFDAVPIFIVGLPRSGSTLIEQILASHPLVEGTHELSDLGRVVQQIPKLLNKRERYPKSLRGLDSQAFGVLGQAYMDRTSKYRSGSAFFTDKNPNNFAHVGLVHLLLPNAVLVNARRHPLDSCLGSFKQLFAKGQAFTYDLTELAEYYLQYYRMMNHWNEVLPAKILDVHYEDVVEDLEVEVRRILEHCGLPFADQCLHFHETDRAVMTASSEQVRRPIYSTSVNLWRNYEKHLQPAIDILAPILRELPRDDRPDHL